MTRIALLLLFLLLVKVEVDSFVFSTSEETKLNFDKAVALRCKFSDIDKVLEVVTNSALDSDVAGVMEMAEGGMVERSVEETITLRQGDAVIIGGV